MIITPRYDGPPLLRFAASAVDLAVPLVRQRRRLAELLGTLDDEQWTAASRCEGWTVRDVVAHLISVDQFWFISVTSALAGTPTRFLEGFDPVATPAALVDGMKEVATADVLARYLAGVELLAEVFSGLDDDQWSILGESPPGHVPLDAVVRHALWDAWIHERDIVLPLGLTPVEEPDEVVACLEYVAALGPAFLAMHDTAKTGALVVDGTDPTAHVVVELGDTVTVHDGDAPAEAVRLRGRSVDLVEALTFRAPFPDDIAAEDRWLFGGLATVFDLVDR